MKLFILEYYSNYTNNNVLAAAKSFASLKELLIGCEHKVIEDKLHIEIYNKLFLLGRKNDIDDKLSKEEFAIVLRTLTQELQTKIKAIEPETYTYTETGTVRLDWLVDELGLPEGLYLVRELAELGEDERERIISNTHYCA